MNEKLYMHFESESVKEEEKWRELIDIENSQLDLEEGDEIDDFNDLVEKNILIEVVKNPFYELDQPEMKGDEEWISPETFYELVRSYEMKPLLRSDIKSARDAYLEYYNCPPEQFNLAYSIFEGWRCEFMKYSSTFSDDFTRWIEDEYEVLKLFFSCDPEEVDLEGWQKVYCDEIGEVVQSYNVSFE